jgi:transposase InsO family protein
LIGPRSFTGRGLSDNGSSYISADLAKWIDGQNMNHVRGAPYHPMTQGKIERWHQTLKKHHQLDEPWPPLNETTPCLKNSDDGQPANQRTLAARHDVRFDRRNCHALIAKSQQSGRTNRNACARTRTHVMIENLALKI